MSSATIRQKLMEIQAEIIVPKSRTNEFGSYNYRNLEDMCRELKPLAQSKQVLFTLDSDIERVGDSNYIAGYAKIEDLETGDSIVAEAKVKEPTQCKAKMDESQTSGSAITYAKKYALDSLLLLDDNVDPDSNEAVDDGTPASPAHINMINELCEKHNGSPKFFYKKMKIKGDPTAKQAGMILNFFKTYFGDE